MDSALSYEMLARDHFAPGEPIVVTFRLTNAGDSDAWVLGWHTPLEGIKGRIFDVSCAGESVAYAGRMMKRGDPAAADYIRIAAGSSAAAEVDLREAYSLLRCDQYVVGFTGRLADVGWNPDDLPRPRDSFRPVVIEGNHVSFRIGD